MVANHGVGGALGDERYTLLLFCVTVALGLLMVSNVRFRSFKDIKINTGTLLFVLLIVGSSVFVWQQFKPQFVLVWLLSVYIFIGLVETARALARRLRGLDERTSVPPAMPH
jgi:CDP-diacylglycerol--serine O-phosphatidyltransferase